MSVQPICTLSTVQCSIVLAIWIQVHFYRLRLSSQIAKGDFTALGMQKGVGRGVEDRQMVPRIAIVRSKWSIGLSEKPNFTDPSLECPLLPPGFSHGLIWEVSHSLKRSQRSLN